MADCDINEEIVGCVYTDDEGTVLRVKIVDADEVAIDVSTATARTIYLTKTDGTVVAKTAVFTTDGTDGLIEYTTVTSDFDMLGIWSIQGRVEMPTGKWRSYKGYFEVKAA